MHIYGLCSCVSILSKVLWSSMHLLSTLVEYGKAIIEGECP